MDLRSVCVASLALLLAAGCEPNPSLPPNPASNSAAAPPASASETFEQLEARLDATIWRDEILALRHEATFVSLRDTLRRATNKVAVLATFDFKEISLPAPLGQPRLLDLDIREQPFNDSDRRSLPHRGWVETLERLHASGWRIEQGEWSHYRFVPPAPGRAATSEFLFHLHGERPPETRFILQGTLGVEWGSVGDLNTLIPAHRLTVSNVTVLERTGAPGFARTAVVTPNAPERHGDMINLHPLMVTDIDRDGDEDVILGGANQLFVNPGDARFTAREFVVEKLFQGSRSAGAVADFDGDGQLDFLTVGSQAAFTNKLTLYRGNGSFPFSQGPAIAWDGFRFVAPSVLTAGDIDSDGDLDVFLAQYKPPGVRGQLPTPYWDARDGYPSYLLINDGQGHFQPAQGNSPLSAKRLRRTFAASFVDLDSDGDLDLMTVNDFAGVDIYHNDGRGQFTDESARLDSPYLFGMGHTFGDFDHDGVLDFLATGMNLPTVQRLEGLKLGRVDIPDRTRWRVEMTYGNRIYTLRDGRWVKPPFGDELARTGWAWGVFAGDFDNDGDLDVYFANGHISGDSVEDYDSHNWRHDVYLGNSREDPKLMYYFAKTFEGINSGRTSWMGHQHNVFLLDVGTNHYRNVAWLMDLAHEPDSRAVVSADLNNDGKLDLLFTDAEWKGGPHTGRNRLRIHLNQLPSGNHWIGIRLLPNTSGISPVGAKVWAKTDSRTYVAQIVTGDSYQSQHPHTVHFGLGQEGKVNEINVRWPNGKFQTIQNPAVDRYHQIKR